MSPLLKSIRELLAYTIWADRTILDALREVRQEDLVRETGASWGSLLGTLVHILGAEKMWLSRFLGSPIPALPVADQYPDRLAVALAYEELWPELEFLLAALTEEQLEGDLTWVNSRGETHTRPFWKAVLHLANHSSYHRGQVVAMLRQLGYQPPATDFVYYTAEPREVAEAE